MTSTGSVSHIKITQAGLIALFVTVGGMGVAFVPSLSSIEQIVISAGSTLIAAIFLVVNSVHAIAGTRPVAPVVPVVAPAGAVLTVTPQATAITTATVTGA